MLALTLGIGWSFGGVLLGETGTGIAETAVLAPPALLGGLAFARLAGCREARPLVVAATVGAIVIGASLVVPAVISALGWLLLPLLVAFPLLASTARAVPTGWLALAVIALPVGLVVGMIALSLAFGLG